MHTKYLIVGNSAGGIGAAEAIRQVDREGTVTIISEERYCAYSRPLIAKYLAGQRTLEEISFRPPDFYANNGILFLSGERVTHLQPDDQIAWLENGQQIAWEKLLLAVGGKPFLPKIEGIDKRGVFTFVNLDDAKAVDRFLDDAKRAVIIGGGLVGISAAEALVGRGVSVTIVEKEDRILNTILDRESSRMVEEAAVRAGVKIVASRSVAEISGHEKVREVALDNGDVVPCDIVLIAAGLSPRCELAVGAGLRVDRGIVVDCYMATSDPNIYACGDAAEAYDFVYGENRLNPVWPNAYVGGRVAGLNMAGIPTRYAGGTAMNSLNYFGIDIASAGMHTPPTGDGHEVVSRQEENTYKKVILKDNFVVGMIFVGDIEKSGIIFGLMKEKVSVESFKKSLLADNFGLVFLPRELWLERLETRSNSFLHTAVQREGEENFGGE